MNDRTTKVSCYKRMYLVRFSNKKSWCTMLFPSLGRGIKPRTKKSRISCVLVCSRYQLDFWLADLTALREGRSSALSSGDSGGPALWWWRCMAQTQSSLASGAVTVTWSRQQWRHFNGGRGGHIGLSVKAQGWRSAAMDGCQTRVGGVASTTTVVPSALSVAIQ